MPRRADEPAGITSGPSTSRTWSGWPRRADCLKAPRWMFESDGRSEDAGTSIVDEDRPDVEGVLR